MLLDRMRGIGYLMFKIDNIPSGGGRKYNIALFAMCFNQLALLSGHIPAKHWSIILLSILAGYGMVNVAQKAFVKGPVE